MSYCYSAFGLTLASEIACPELPPGNGPADIRIRCGSVPEHLSTATARGPFHESTPSQCLLRLEQAASARFLINAGQEIVLERTESGNEETVRTYLLGSALAALLYQRQILPLHGSVVASSAGAVLLAGASGVGKSTLAAVLARRGRTLLADDICAVTLDQAGRPLAHPAWPALKLAADTLARFQFKPAAPGSAELVTDKYQVSPESGFCGRALPLHSVYVLCPAAVSRPRLTRLRGADSVALLQRQVYRGEYAADLGRLPLHFQTVTAVATHSRTYRVERPIHGFLLEALADAISATWPEPAAGTVAPLSTRHG